MATHGKASAVLIGANDPTRFLTDYTVSMAADAAESTGFQMSAKEYVVGQSDATVTFSGRYQGSQNAAERVFERIQDNADGDPFFVGMTGWVPGSRCRFGTVLRTGFDVSASVGDVIGTSVNLQATAGIRIGWSLGRSTNPAGTRQTVTVDTVDDGTVSQWNGAVAQVIVVANTLNAAATVTFQHSTNGTTWVDLPDLTFAASAGAGYAVAKTTGTKIERYVRASISVPAGTTGSADIIPAIGRI